MNVGAVLYILHPRQVSFYQAMLSLYLGTTKYLLLNFQFYSFTLRNYCPNLFLSWHEKSLEHIKQRYNIMTGLCSNSFAKYKVKKTEDQNRAYSMNDITGTAIFFPVPII